MRNSEKYKYYLRDLIYIIKERKSEMKKKSDQDEFKEGVAFAYESILELIENQASAFQIDPSEFGFDDFEVHQRKQ